MHNNKNNFKRKGINIGDIKENFKRKGISLGNINNKKFKFNLCNYLNEFNHLIPSLQKNFNNNSETNIQTSLHFYSHHIAKSGYKFRQIEKLKTFTILNTNLIWELNDSFILILQTYYDKIKEKEKILITTKENKITDIAINFIIQEIKDTHYNLEELVIKEYQRTHCLGQYSEDNENNFCNSIDFNETLDQKVFLDII